MLKSTIHIFLSGLIMLSVMAPPVLTFFDVEIENFIIKEEKQEKKEKDLEEKEIYFYNSEKADSLSGNTQEEHLDFYDKNFIDQPTKILLPPPEHLC